MKGSIVFLTDIESMKFLSDIYNKQYVNDPAYVNGDRIEIDARLEDFSIDTAVDKLNKYYGLNVTREEFISHYVTTKSVSTALTKCYLDAKRIHDAKVQDSIKNEIDANVWPLYAVSVLTKKLDERGIKNIKVVILPPKVSASKEAMNYFNDFMQKEHAALAYSRVRGRKGADELLKINEETGHFVFMDTGRNGNHVATLQQVIEEKTGEMIDINNLNRLTKILSTNEDVAKGFMERFADASLTRYNQVEKTTAKLAEMGQSVYITSPDAVLKNSENTRSLLQASTRFQCPSHTFSFDC